MGGSWGGEEELGGGIQKQSERREENRGENQNGHGTEGDMGTTTFWAGAPFTPRKH